MSTVTSITCPHCNPRNDAPTFAQWVDDRREWVDNQGRDYPMAPLVQIDGWEGATEGAADPIRPPDHEGDVMVAGGTYEPQASDTDVRVNIAGDAETSDAIRLLRKAADWLERDPDLIHRLNPARPYDPNYDEPPPF